MENDTRLGRAHRPGLVLLVLALLLLIAYLTTDWMVKYPFAPLISLLTVMYQSGFQSLVDGPHLQNDLWVCWFIPETGLSYDDQRRALLATIALGFLASYYLPRHLVRKATVACCLGGLWWIVGWLACGLMVLSLGVVYLAFHQPSPVSRFCLVYFLCFVSLFAYTGFLSEQATRWFFFATALLSYPVYLLLYFLNHERCWGVSRFLSVHSCWLVLTISLCVQSDGGKLFIPAGLLLQFFLWERLVFYSVDFQDGMVPKELSWADFLATFLSPATLVNMSWLNRIGKGYAYLSESFLARDQNEVVQSGLRLMAVALVFLVLKYPILDGLSLVFLAAGVEVLTLWELTTRIELGSSVTLASIWSALLRDFLAFYLTWSVIAHFKVATWRLMGYDIAPYFQYPFLSTNIVEMWRRYSFYYREFLLAAFYYPVFLALRSFPRWLRTVLATLAAATLGNFLYHLLEALLYDQGEASVVVELFRTLPYFLIFGLAIALTSLYLSWKGPGRKAWSPGIGLLFDVLGVVATFGFYILVRVMNHVPKEHSFTTAAKILLGAFGL